MELFRGHTQVPEVYTYSFVDECYKWDNSNLLLWIRSCLYWYNRDCPKKWRILKYTSLKRHKRTSYYCSLISLMKRRCTPRNALLFWREWRQSSSIDFGLIYCVKVDIHVRVATRCSFPLNLEIKQSVSCVNVHCYFPFWPLALTVLYLRKDLSCGSRVILVIWQCFPGCNIFQ